MDASRLTRVRSTMKAAGLDALFVSNPRNVLYVTGIRPMMSGEVQPFNDPEYFALIDAERCDVLCDGRYFAEVNRVPGVSAQLLESPTSAAVIARKITDLLGGGAKTIGCEHHALLHDDATGLFAETRGLTWRKADDVLTGLRLIKSADEIAKIRRAQQITDQAFTHTCKFIRVGMTEREVALEIDNFLRRHSEGNSFSPIVAFGETSCHPHYLPSPQRRLEKGQMVLLDFGAIYEGYCGDMTRMLVMGRADARQREVYDLVLQAQQRCLDGVRPGMTCHDLDNLCRSFFEQRGCADQFVHGTGHGVGLAIHEDPRIKKTFQNKVDVGMVFTVEPGLYFEGWGGVRIEDMVAVTPGGCDNLTVTSKKLVELDV